MKKDTFRMRSRRNTAYGIYLGDLDRRRTESQGMISYSLALTRSLSAALDPHERLVVFCSRAVHAELGVLDSSGCVDVTVTEPPTGLRQQLHQQELRVARDVAASGIDVIHFPRGRAPLRSLAPTRVVATVHDDIPMQYRAGRFGPRRRDLKSAYVVASLKRTLATADAILTDTNFSCRQLKEVSTPSAPIRVVVPGLTIASSRPAAAVRAHRFVVFDAPFAHKRSDEAAEFTVRYIHERGILDHKVLLLGSGRASIVRQKWPEFFEHESGPIASDRLEDLVRSSRAVVVSSRYEGLGLPALEAWALGTPAVVADCEAAQEMLHGIPGLYRAGDYPSFARALDSLLAIGSAEYQVLSNLVNARCDWGRASSEVLALYREIATASTGTSARHEEHVR
jgi:glycosyltransferase involved in cell wall biosynthesis